MPALVTSNFRIVNAKAFVDSFEEPENGGRNTVVGQSYVYLFIGKILSWDKTHAGYSDSKSPPPDGDVQGNEFVPWRDMIALDRVIANTDISFAAKRYDWASGEIYDQYDDTDPQITKATAKYYVYETSSNRVFKCLDNNNGVQSTVNPKEGYLGPTNYLPFVTSDGYRWKYMCTVSTDQYVKWLTTNYIPILTLNAIPGSGEGGGIQTQLSHPPGGFADQANVQKNANTGTIETYFISSGGSGFTKHSGGVALADRIVTTAAADHTVVVGTPVSTTDFFSLDGADGLLTGQDNYKGSAIFVSNTTHQKGVGWIKASGTLDYPAIGLATVEGQQRAVLLDPGLAPEYAVYVDEPGVKYEIGPIIEVTGDGLRNTDGSGGANAYAICTSTGVISQINAWTPGNNYTTATVSVIGSHGENPTGIGLQARAVIAPPGGHGSDPGTELGAFNVVIAKTLTGPGILNTTTGVDRNFPVSNQYRTVGLVRNPYLKEGYDATELAPATGGKNWYANSSPLHQSTLIVANSTKGIAGSYIPAEDDDIKGLKSGATGRIIEFNTYPPSPDGNQIINITNITANNSGGTFMFNERIGLVKTKDGTTYDDGVKYVTANGWTDEAGTTWNNGGDLAFDDNSTVIYEPDLQPYTGDILYIEHRTPIIRSEDQAEDIKIVIEF